MTDQPFNPGFVDLFGSAKKVSEQLPRPQGLAATDGRDGAAASAKTSFGFKKDGEPQSRAVVSDGHSEQYGVSSTSKGVGNSAPTTRTSPEPEPVTADTEGRPRADEASRSFSSSTQGGNAPPPLIPNRGADARPSVGASPSPDGRTVVSGRSGK